MVKRPPGRSTLNISRKTLCLSGVRLITQFETTTSIVSSLIGIASAIPLRNSTFDEA